MGKVVVLNLVAGDLQQGFSVTLEIGEDGYPRAIHLSGKLPAAQSILEDYLRWQSILCPRSSTRGLQRVPGLVTNVSWNELSDSLKISLNSWLNSEQFRPIREKLLEELNKDDEVRVIVQAADIQLRRLPWHLWDFFEKYPKAEVALSTDSYQRVTPTKAEKEQVKILAILGNSEGIDIKKDREILENLPDAETCFLVSPDRSIINDHLWEQPWDILFFAGHSRTEGETGRIYINDTDSLTIAQLKYALKKAIAQGLQLAIFNSCDGLGLAQELSDLHIPQMIVMREPVPDKVAQEFLKYFLPAFAGGKPFYLAVREARERLQGLEKEFPCATWLPVICTNPAQLPPTWEMLSGKKSDGDLDEYGGYKALIREKIQKFCGREFVFDAIQEFLSNEKRGYFTVVGDPGMGKSAIAAKYIDDKKCPCFFNIRAEGSNRPELFLNRIRQQLIQRYNLANASQDDLPILLDKVSKKLGSGERLTIVVDALDEVEQEGSKNLLYLPKTLPEGVYFLLTRRPYTRESKRFDVSPDVPVSELDLRQHKELSRSDVSEYIRLFLTVDPEYKEALNRWITERHLAPEQFIEQVADKSENNFMYLRYVLPAIAGGAYKDLSLAQLPEGLHGYYQDHWVQMGMDKQPQENQVIILFILKEVGSPIPCEMIADITQQDEYEVQQVLDKWVEFLKNNKIEGYTCYSIYHTTFLEFLKAQKRVDAKRKLFKEANQRLVNYWKRGEQEDDTNDDEKV